MKMGNNNSPRKIVITLPLEIAETLHALIDGSIGCSGCDDFNSQMIPVRDLLEKKIIKANK